MSTTPQSNHPPGVKRVLFKIDTGTYYTGLIKVALALKNTGRFEPVMLFNNDHPSIATFIEDSRRQYLRTLNGLPKFEPAETVKYNSALQRLPLGLQRRDPLKVFWQYRSKIKAIRQFLVEQRISGLVYGGENAWYDTALFNKVAREQGIPTIALPQWMAGPREPAEHIFNDPEYSLKLAINRMAGLLWPKWTINFQGKKLIRLPGQEVFARELLGLAPPLPWVLHSGQTDIIAVENQAMYDYGMREGLPSSQLRVVGSIDHDVMAQAQADRTKLRQILCNEYNLPADKPLILSAVPPDFLSGHRLDVCEFTSYHDLLSFWITTIRSQASVAVIFHAHPAATKEDLIFMRSLGATVVDRPISKLIPLADIFVASISSTIQWAIACGLPVVNYDVYRYRYHDYDSAPGVMTVEKQEEFITALSRVTTDQHYRSELQQRQQSVTQNWGRLDGKAELRIIEIFDTIMADRSKTVS